MATSAVSSHFDLIVRSGQIYDGTGSPSFLADIGIRSGRIAEVGRIAGRGVQEIDADGMIVAPGFVDIHTHYDGQVT